MDRRNKIKDMTTRFQLALTILAVLGILGTFMYNVRSIPTLVKTVEAHEIRLNKQDINNAILTRDVKWIRRGVTDIQKDIRKLLGYPTR